MLFLRKRSLRNWLKRSLLSSSKIFKLVIRSYHHYFHLFIRSAAGLEPKLEGTVVDEVEDEVDIYEASSPKQLSCSALSVMAMNFARFIREVKPTYLAAAFDSSRKSLVRATVLPSYKSQRPATPTDLIPQLLAAPSLLEAFGCKCFRLDGHEADDLMASISRWGRGKGLNVVHVSIDKDMLQLVNTGVHVMRPGNFEVMGKEAVFEKFGVLPESLVDLLALMGDGADNIPGARGIGPKTAALLVNKFKSIEKMYEALGLDTLTLPAVDTEMKNAEEKKKVELLLKQAMPSDKLNHALEQVKSLGAKMQPIAILTSLYHLGYERAVLYRDLIRLKDDIDFESALLTSRPPVVPSSTADTAVNSNNNVLSTSFFRFRGESREWEVEDPQQRLEAIVGSMSTSLRKPLSMLRQQYHKIDRS